MSWYLRCSWCGGSFKGGNCRRCTNVSFGDEFVRNPDPIFYDETPNFSYPPPQPQTYWCELCGNDSHYGYDCPPRVPLVYEQEPCYNQNFGDNNYPQNSPSFPQQYLCCENCGGPHRNFQCQPRNQNFYEPNLCYNSNSSGFDQPPHTHTPDPSRRFNSICYDDDDDNDDEESTIPLNEIISQIPPFIAITPVLLTMEPEDSLIIRDENLSTIPEKESDEFIKSNVKDLVPIPSESEDTSDNASESDLPFCDNFVTFSNPLFNDNDDLTSSDDESPPKEDVLKENFKIYSNPFFEFDDEYISSDINLLFNEVLQDTESKESYVSKLEEPDLLVTPLSKLNEDECFDPGERDILLLENFLNDDLSSPLPPKELNFEELKVIKSDVSIDFEDDYYDLGGDIIYLESLLIKNTILNLPPEVFLDHDLRSLEDEPDKDDLESMVKVFDPVIHKEIISPTYVRFTFEDRYYLSLTFVIKIFVSFLTYLMNSLFLLSSGSEDTIFDPNIFAFSFYSLEPTVSHRSGTFMIARIMKALVLVVLSIVHSSFNP
ncbi:hypothetical protein Tco_1516132 [Tanacetum coccineum]